MEIVDKTINKLLGKNKKYQKKVNVRFPNSSGDESREMTLQELKDNHSECLLINPVKGESVTIDDIETLDLREVVAMPPLQGG